MLQNVCCQSSASNHSRGAYSAAGPQLIERGLAALPQNPTSTLGLRPNISALQT